MFPFTSAQLTGVVNKRRPVRTPILDAHFTNRRQMFTPEIQIDVQNSPEGLALAISAGAKSLKARQAGWSTYTLTLPRFSEHDMVKAADIKGYRAIGTEAAMQAFMQMVNKKMDDIRSRFDRTMEYMAIKGMQGQVVDGGGNVIASYGVPGAVNINFSASTDDPVDVFDDAAVSIARTLGGDPGGLIAYCGVVAYKRLRNHDKVQTLLTGPAGPGMLEGGEVRRVGGVQIRRLPNVFVNNAGSEVPFMDDNTIVIASDQMGGELMFGPCETPTGLELVNYFVDTWTERDPAGEMLRLETNPLPVVTRPDSIRRYTVG